MSHRVALIGAGGKMGTRIARNLGANENYSMLCCETATDARAKLEEGGYTVVPSNEAVAEADTTILAVPDRLIGRVSGELVPLARPGAAMLLLDPAAAAAGELLTRDDMTFVVCHPCHPPLFGDQLTAEARQDFFGGVAAWQDIVIALVQGSEEHCTRTEELCRVIFAPVREAHRITVEQMAILEPAMAEVVGASAALLMRDAMEEAICRGVPRPAAESFMLGHAQVPLAIVFGVIGSPFSDAAQIAIKWGTERLLNPNWREVFEPDQVQAVIRAMLHPEEGP